jgi:hypothetical protein
MLKVLYFLTLRATKKFIRPTNKEIKFLKKK